MHRIDTSTALKDKFGSGKNGYTDGDPSTGRQATDLDADMFDELQEEICAPIEEAGITLQKGVRNQLLTALKKLFLAEDDSRVSGALQKAKNLSDVADASVTLSNIGGVPTTRKINSKALSADITLSAGDVDAFPAEGGTVGSKGVTTHAGFCVTGSGLPATEQGMYHAWNEGDGDGAGAIVVNPGTGAGGLNIRFVNSDNSVQTGVVTIGSNGSLNTSNTLNEMGQRVYSPNNPPPIAASAVTGVKIGARVMVPNLNGTPDWSGQVPAGAVLIAALTEGDNRITNMYYAYVMYCVNGNWINTGT